MRRTREGVQRPPIFEASDGAEYVLKLDEHDPDFPIAELVSASLAAPLGVPIPPFARLWCPRLLTDALRESGDPDLVSFSVSFDRLGGACFGSRYLPEPVQRWRSGLRSLVPDCDDALRRVFVFDAFIENMDRSAEHNPNLVVSGNALYAIDHGQALPSVKGVSSWTYPYASHVAWPVVERMRVAVFPHIERLRDVPVSALDAAVASVPAAWWTPARADFVRSALIARQHTLADTLERMMRQG